MPDLSNEEISQIADGYLTQEKGWESAEYTLVPTDRKDDMGHLIVNARHRDDEAQVAPGGGKSVELHIDTTAKRVVRELHFQ